MGAISFLKALATGVAIPAAGKVALFVDQASGVPSYKDDTGTVYSLVGADGQGIQLDGRVATYADLPTSLTSADAGTAYIVDADDLLYVWDGAAWPADGSGMLVDGKSVLSGPNDPTGSDGTVGDFFINTTTDTIFGPKTTAGWMEGTSMVGPPGADGAEATVQVGDTTTVAPGTPAAVSNSGTSSAAILDFDIPQGEKGDPGQDGTDGLLAGINDQTSTTYTLQLSDLGKEVRCTNAAAITLAIPINSAVPFAIGTWLLFSQGGAGIVTATPNTGVTLRTPNGGGTTTQYDVRGLEKIGTDEWRVV